MLYKKKMLLDELVDFYNTNPEDEGLNDSVWWSAQ